MHSVERWLHQSAERQLELLEVAKQLRQAGLEFKFHFIGHINSGDPYATAFLAAIKPMEEEGLARYLGPKNTSELIECYDSAAALVHFRLRKRLVSLSRRRWPATSNCLGPGQGEYKISPVARRARSYWR